MNFEQLNAFVAKLNFLRRAHVVRERRLYYGETVSLAEQNYESLAAVKEWARFTTVYRTSYYPQYEGQKLWAAGGRYLCGVEFLIRDSDGAVFVWQNGKLLHRGNVKDTAYWQCHFRPHETLDKPFVFRQYSLCEFRKSERMRRLSKLKPYEL